MPDVERFDSERGTAQHACRLHGSDRPLPPVDQPFQNVEEVRIEVSPLRSLLEVRGVLAITLLFVVGEQVPGNAQTLPPTDCPQQAVLDEIANVARVAILHRFRAA